MNFKTSIQNFTDVYNQQAFMQDLRNSADVFWMECNNISGTDCYCDDDAQTNIKKFIAEFGNEPGIHFFDNGNYHYMSKLWTDSIHEDFDLVIFDHHPDMQPPRFEGILSCGGWVKEVFDHNVHIKNAVLIGVADHLIEEIKNDPTAEFENYSDRVTFVTESEILEKQKQGIPLSIPGKNQNAIYISIDKDALCLKDAVTNWDQGSLTQEQLAQTLQDLFSSRKVLGVDICGERAQNQDYAEGIDENQADSRNDKLNEKLYLLLQDLFARL